MPTGIYKRSKKDIERLKKLSIKNGFKKKHKINVGRITSEETREKISKKNKGRKFPYKARPYSKGRTPWNKGTIQPRGSNAHNWKGLEAKYGAIHCWIRKYKGKPVRCECCGCKDNRKYHWSNISGKYRRDLDDYESLCVPCHKRKDLRNKEWRIP